MQPKKIVTVAAMLALFGTLAGAGVKILIQKSKVEKIREAHCESPKWIQAWMDLIGKQKAA